MKKLIRFPLKTVYSAVLLALSPVPVYAVSTGGCDNYIPTTGQTVTCTPSITPAATNGVQTATNSGNNNVTVNVNSGTVLSFQGSPIGIGSASTVINAGTLNSGTFNYGYGISFGANGRSGAGGNTVTNTASGVIQTAGADAAGIYVNAPNATAAVNSITNNGSIATTGSGDSFGIKLINRNNTDAISNSGSISSATTYGIYVNGSANITSSGAISGATTAIYFDPATANTRADTLTLQSGATISGAIAFNTTKTSETLVFDGLTNANFNNTLTGANIIKAINGASVTMNSAAGYAFGAGQMNVDRTSSLTISGVILDGAIATSLTKTGAGTLSLSGINTYTGTTDVQAGALVLTGSVTSNTTVASGATLQGGGTINGSLTNAGNVQPATGSVRTTLTVTGNYTGSSGTFTTNTYGGQLADILAIGGTASGSTAIVVGSGAGLGQATTGNGIQVVTTGSSAASAFSAGRIAAGAYEYTLVKVGNNWYLQANNDAPPPPQPVTPETAQRVEVGLYPALPTLARLYAQNVVDSYDQRRGDLALLSDGSTNRKSGMAWGRLIGKTAKSDPSNVSFGPMLNSRTYGIQLGIDALASQNPDGSQSFVGPFATFGQATGNVSNQSGSTQTGSVSLMAYSLGLNATHITPAGHYIDAVLQGTRFDQAQANSLVSTSLWTQGWGMTASLEGGYNLKFNPNLALVPQVQVIYNLNRLQTAQDAYSQVVMPSDSSTLGRVGAKLSYTDDPKSSTASNVWARVSGLSMLSGANTQTQFSNLVGTNTTTFNTQAPTTWVAFDLGVNQRIAGNHLVYLNAGYESALSTMYQAGYVKGGYTYRF